MRTNGAPIKEDLIARRTELIYRLAHMAAPAHRDESTQLAELLRETEYILDCLHERRDPTYLGAYIDAIDAIEKVLSILQRPAARERIATLVTSRGFRPGCDERANRANVKRSLTYFLSGRGTSKNRIKEIGGLVGLYEWDLDLFPRVGSENDNGPVRIAP